MPRLFFGLPASCPADGDSRGGFLRLAEREAEEVLAALDADPTGRVPSTASFLSGLVTSRQQI